MRTNYLALGSFVHTFRSGRATNEHGRMCGGLAKFNNRYFQGKGNVEASVTRLELIVAGMLGVCCDASNGKQAGPC